MKSLIAIVSCHKNSDFRDCQRETWIPELEGKFDYKFFLGRGDTSYQPLLDEVLLDCSDGYLGLPEKVREICRWALQYQYSHLFKCDDDTYIVPSRLLLSNYERYDYMGRVRIASGKYRAPYAVGGPGYSLSRLAFTVVADAELTEDSVEDRWIGNVLYDQDIHATHNDNFSVLTSYHQESPLVTNSIISSCELHGPLMLKAHEKWLAGAQPNYLLRPNKQRVFGDLNRAKE